MEHIPSLWFMNNVKDRSFGDFKTCHVHTRNDDDLQPTLLQCQSPHRVIDSGVYPLNFLGNPK